MILSMFSRNKTINGRAKPGSENSNGRCDFVPRPVPLPAGRNQRFFRVFTTGQGMIEALLLIFGIIFIFAVALPGVSSKARLLKTRNLRDQNLTVQSNQNENSPLCGDIIAIPSSQGKTPFKVFLVGTEKQGKYKISGFRWDFTGDGSWDTEVTKEPQNYTFELPGEYNVKMVVIDEKNNTQTCVQTITVTE